MSVDRREPVGNTCPIIDSTIDSIKDFKQDLLSDIESKFDDLFSVFRELEELRSANSALRNWGNDLVYALDKSEEENEELQLKINDLESKNEDLENRINELEYE